MTDRAVPGKARGIIGGAPAPGLHHHARHAAASDLAPWIEHFWIVRWDLRGQPPLRVATLPHPSVHLTIEGSRAEVTGVCTRRFERDLAGVDGVFGIKFKPGGFRPFVDRPVAAFSDRTTPLREVFGDAGETFARELNAHAPDDEAMIAIAERFVRERAPAPDPEVARVSQWVLGIIHDREITRVEQLAERAGMNTRALQRLFRDYVGVSPKWVIARYRLHEALERLGEGLSCDWPRLAQDLGYYDQAHLIRDFKRMVGVTPAEYARGRAIARA